MLHVMIMAGGGGTRFWPRSRNARPKQFLAFSGDRSLLQGTFDRTAAVVPAARTWVVTSAAYVDETAKQLPELPRDQIVGEPFRRDTAPCVGLGAALIAATDPDATVAVLPADHVIEPEREFHRALHASEQFAADSPECLFTFGIRPTSPSTGYGYIHRGERVGERNGVPLYRVREFKEKPSAEVAAQFVESGEYDWNSGIFVWKAKTILAQLKVHRPDIHAACVEVAAAWPTPDRERVFRDVFEGVNGTSIDYAVMQEAGRAGRVRVLRAPYQWDDVGSWLALERHNPQDAAGNTATGGEGILIDAHGCVVSADPGHVVAAIGVSDLVIIQAGKAVLVARREDEARVREVVEKLKQNGSEHL